MDPEQIKAFLKDPAKMDEHHEKMFALLDKDKKGYIVPEEVKAGLKEKLGGLGIPFIELDKDKEEALLKVADPTGSGKVTLDGFKAALKAFREKILEIIKNPTLVEEHAKKLFEKLDHDKKGYLDIAIIEDIAENKLNKLNVPIPRLPKEQREQLKKVADPNGTGKITLDGYKAMVKAVIEKMKADGLF